MQRINADSILLQQSAKALHQLREQILAKKTIDVSSQHFMHSLDSNDFKEWIKCTAFLNHIIESDYLNGNFFSKHVQNTLKTSRSKKSKLQEEFNASTRKETMAAVGDHVNANVAYDFYASFSKTFEQLSFWHKLVFRLIKRAYVKLGEPKADYPVMQELASLANDEHISQHAFMIQLQKLFAKLSNDIKQQVKLQDLLHLHETWEALSFLAHLKSHDFLKAYNAFLEDKKIFENMINNIVCHDQETKAYLVEYALFLKQTEKNFINAMALRAQLRLKNTSNSFCLNPLIYVYDRLSSGYFEFEDLSFPPLQFKDEVKREEDRIKFKNAITIPLYDELEDDVYDYYIAQVGNYLKTQPLQNNPLAKIHAGNCLNDTPYDEECRKWLLSHINCYVLMEELYRLTQSASHIQPTTECTDNIRLKLDKLQAYVSSATNDNVIALLKQQQAFFEKKYLLLKEHEHQANIEKLIQQMLTHYYNSDMESLDQLLNLLNAAISQYELFIKEHDIKRDAWAFALRATIAHYQALSKLKPNQVNDPTPLVFIYNRCQNDVKEREEKISRLHYHLEKELPQCLKDNGAMILKLLESNTSINYLAQPSMMVSQTVIAKKNRQSRAYALPPALKPLLTGSDLDARITFLNEKSATFIAIDDGFKAASALLAHSYAGFETNDYLDAITKINVALFQLQKEMNEKISMDLFDRWFFHSKTWEIKNVWKNQAAEYFDSMKMQYKMIMNDIKTAFLQELKNGQFNNKLYKAYQAAVHNHLITHDSDMDTSIRKAALLFPFVLTKAGDIDHQLSTKHYADNIMSYVYKSFSVDERKEYYNLIIDKIMQGLLEEASLIGGPLSYDLFDLSQQKTQRVLKFEQIAHVINILKEKVLANKITLDFANSPLVNNIKDFINDTTARLKESSENETLILMSDLLRLDASSYQDELNKIDSLLVKRRENDAIIKSAHEFAKKIVTHSEAKADLMLAVNQLSDDKRQLFLAVFHDTLSPYLKYLLDLSYQCDLTKDLQHELSIPKSQLLTLLQNDVILDEERRDAIFAKLFKNISLKTQLDFFDKRILLKMTALKLTAKQLGVDINYYLKLIENQMAGLETDFLSIALCSALEIKEAIVTYMNGESSLTPAKKLLFLNHINRLSGQEFKAYYLDAFPYNDKLAELIEESNQETFKEDYRFKKIHMVLQDVHLDNKKTLERELNELNEQKVTLSDYIGSDNVFRLVGILSEQCKSYEISLQQTLLSKEHLPEPLGLLNVAIFNQFLNELSSVKVADTDVRFKDILLKLQLGLPYFSQLLPLLKAFNASFENPQYTMKSLGFLKVYRDGLLQAPKAKSETSTTFNLNDLFKKLLKLNNQGAINEEIACALLSRDHKEHDYQLLQNTNTVTPFVFFTYFQKPALSQLEKRINEIASSHDVNALLVLHALIKNDVMNTVFNIQSSETNTSDKEDYLEQFNQVKNKIAQLWQTQCDQVVSLDVINRDQANKIEGWLSDQFAMLGNGNVALPLDYCIKLIHFYLRNREVFDSKTQHVINHFLAKNDEYIKNYLIPNLHPNSPYFLIDATNEDKNGMAVKEKRELLFNRNAVLAMIYQACHPESTAIKDGLNLVKTAYFARGVNQDDSISRCENINPQRSSHLTFRYNAFEAFTREPLNKLFFDDMVSPIIAFFGSYRVIHDIKEGSPWKNKILELYAHDNLLNRIIALWHAFFYELQLYAISSDLSKVDLQCQQIQEKILSLLHASRSDVGSALLALDRYRLDFLDGMDALIDGYEAHHFAMAHERLSIITNIIFSIPETLSTLQQKQVYVIKLLMAGINQERAAFFNLALDELKSLMSIRSATYFDLSLLSANERSFTEKICISQGCQQNEVSCTTLAELIQTKLSAMSHDKHTLMIETKVEMAIKMLRNDVFEYLYRHLVNKQDEFMIYQALDNQDVIPKFDHADVQKRFLIIRTMLKNIHMIMVNDCFAVSDDMSTQRSLMDVIMIAKQSMQVENVASSTLVGKLESCAKTLGNCLQQTHKHRKVMQ